MHKVDEIGITFRAVMYMTQKLLVDTVSDWSIKHDVTFKYVKSNGSHYIVVYTLKEQVCKNSTKDNNECP